MDCSYADLYDNGLKYFKSFTAIYYWYNDNNELITNYRVDNFAVKQNKVTCNVMIIIFTNIYHYKLPTIF